MDVKFWDERYSSSEYAYGVEPNIIYKEYLDEKMPGKILFPAEGEGRNAVYAALKGWEVYAFDISKFGKQKTELLSAEYKVNVHYKVCDFDQYDFSHSFFDQIGMIFTHLPENIRQVSFRKMIKYLKSGGELMVLGYSKQQYGKNTGGPKELDMLFSEQQLMNDFSEMENKKIEFFEMKLNEGIYHQGMSSLIKFTASKK